MQAVKISEMYEHLFRKINLKKHLWFRLRTVAMPQLRLLQMSSNSSLQVSHPLEKPSAACPAYFRRGWRDFWSNTSLPSNQPPVPPPIVPPSILLHPSMDAERSLFKRGGCFDLFSVQPLLLFLFPLSAKGHTKLLIDQGDHQLFSYRLKERRKSVLKCDSAS